MEKNRIQEMKKDILNSFIVNQEKITRQNLLYLIALHQEGYKQGLITYGTMKALNQAIKEIWENEFDCEIDIQTNNY